MIDLHCHMLPDIDDGARMVEGAVAMSRLAVEDGIEVAVVPPIHTGARPPRLREALDQAGTLVGRDKAQRLLLGHRTEPQSV